MTNVDGFKSHLEGCEKPSIIPSQQARGRGGTRGAGGEDASLRRRRNSTSG